MKAQHVVEISEGIRVNTGRFGRIAYDIAEYPASDMGIVAGDDKSTDDADPADPGKVPVAELVEDTDDVGLTCPSYGEFREHHRSAEEYDNQEVNQQEASTAAFKGSSGELPDVAETDS